MHVVIIGAGRIGTSLARWLVSAGHEIAVVDRNRDRCDVLDGILGSVCVLGDGTDVDTLARAGSNRADVMIATSGDDDVNLVACQLLKHHFGVSRLISVINDSDHVDLFNTLGINLTVDIPGSVLERIQESLSTEGLVHLMSLAGISDRSLVAIKIPPHSGTEGCSIRDISLPDGTLISLVISREGDISIPSDGTIIRAGDEIVAITSAEEENELRNRLTQEPEA